MVAAGPHLDRHGHLVFDRAVAADRAAMVDLAAEQRGLHLLARAADDSGAPLVVARSRGATPDARPPGDARRDRPRDDRAVVRRQHALRPDHGRTILLAGG